MKPSSASARASPRAAEKLRLPTLPVVLAGVAAFLVRRAQHHGVILRSMPGDIVAFCPPLIVKESEIDEMLAGFGKALDDTAAMVREKGLA